MSLVVENLSYDYDGTEILKNISFDAEESEIISILGPNGSGKTTLLNCLTHILNPQCKSVVYNDIDLKSLSLKEMARYISYVPQNYNMVFELRVIDIILMGRIPHAGMKLSKNDENIAFTVLELMNLTKLAFRRIRQISGGERQRVIIARALVQEAPILLIDEPTNNLDIKNKLETLSLIKKTVRDNNLIAIMTLHDINLAGMFSDKIIMLKDRKLFKAGTANYTLNEENLKAVYGVDTIVHNHSEEIFIRILKSD